VATKDEGRAEKKRIFKIFTLYLTVNGIRLIRSRNRRWARHVVGIIELRNSYKIFFGKSEGMRPNWRLFGDTGVYGCIKIDLKI
jgi:hypothetical protein